MKFQHGLCVVEEIYTGAKVSEGVSKSFFEKISNEANESIAEGTPIVICGPGHAREKIGSSD